MERDIEKAAAAADEARPGTGHSVQNSISSIRRISLVVPPPPPAKDEGYRPATSSTRRLSFSTTTSSSQKTIKYGRGKHAATELSPQPSDDPEDPLNWPQWKKELNFVALLFMAGLIAGMKTAFISTNGVMAARYQRSYSAVAALTAVPLILSSVTGMGSLIASKIWGKRPVYLASFVLIFIGTLVNMRMLDNYGGCMAGRIFQGFGWGAFDTLLLGSIQETFYEHERGLRIAIYNTLTVAVMWGGPLFGGLASRNAQRFTLQFEVINSLYFIAIPLLFLGTAETTFDRQWSMLARTPASSWSATFGPLRPRGQWRIHTKDDIMTYLKTVPLYEYEGSADSRTILQAPKAFIAPTTVILFVATFMPYCSLWAFAESLSLIFSAPPFLLDESSLGSIMAGTFILTVLIVGGFSAYKNWLRNFTPQISVLTTVAGTFLAATGILAFGLEIHNILRDIPSPDSVADEQEADDIVNAFMSSRVSLPLIAFLLGLLAAGSCILDATIPPLIIRSTQFTGSNLNVSLRNSADMTAGVHLWRTFFAGIFVQAIPSALEASRGALRGHAIGLGVSQMVIAAGVGACWWFWDEKVRRWDGQVMGLVDLSMLKRAGSFFDHD